MDNANQQRTDAYRHDNEVIALRRQLDDITRLVSDMVWAVGTDFRITHVSHRVKELLGYHPTELYNRKLLDIGQVMTDDGEPTVFDWRSPFRDLRFDVVGKDGRLRHLLISGLPVYTPQTQEFKGFRGTARDITSARRAAECQR
ncbi:MAG: PAS domain S-box protein, partial [Sphingomonadales bacterium]